eukprot:scaffold243701_cov44-Prasinocladus_malaysianus.AAC.1
MAPAAASAFQSQTLEPSVWVGVALWYEYTVSLNRHSYEYELVCTRTSTVVSLSLERVSTVL